MAPRHSNTLMVLFSGVLTLALVYVFYASPLRARIENKLFDIRTRLAPNFLATDHVAVVAIDDAAIAALAAPAPAAKDLSYEGLERVVLAALATPASTVAVLLPPQVFSYSDPGLARLAEIAKKDRRLVLGTFDLTLQKSDPEGLPAALRSVLPQIAKADVIRDFRREIVRDLRVAQDGELPFLPRAVAARLDATAADALDQRIRHGSVTLKLNYFPKDSLLTVRADDLVKDPEAASAALSGRAVFIGYTTYRPWTMHAHEATLVNSPWESDGQDLQNGLPVVSLQAIAVENIVRGNMLDSAPTYVNVLQTTILALLTLFIWRLGVGFASFLFIGGWSLILLFHAALFAFAHLYVPLADAALISTVTMMSGALARLRIEGRLRAAQEAKALSEAELARVQDRFLNRFAIELAEINGRVKTALERHKDLKTLGGTAGTAYVRALGSSEELEDYLQGIHQFAALPSQGLKKPRLASVDLVEVTDKVLRQFESRRREQRIAVEVVNDSPESGKPCLAYADRMLVGQILYNLVSNAIKYAPEGTAVTIRLLSTEHVASIRVRDHGPGIPEEFQAQIFEKFYRVKDDYVYKLKGHGLGLYLSRYFAGQIDASLAVSSTVGQGAEFTLTLRPAKGAT